MPESDKLLANPALRRAIRVGIDVGGTFTDLAAVESWSGRRLSRKVPSTPRDPHRAALEALAALLREYDEPPDVELLAHSTTIATNALLGQIGLELPRTALVTTRGFRDVIEIGRQNRSELYDLFVERPRPLVARADRLVVRERVDHHGHVLEPLLENEIAGVCAALRERNVAAVAVCLLHSYANDAHERMLGEAVTTALPGARVTLSSRVDPQYREYERFSTAVVNAVLAPIVETYLEGLLTGLRRRDIVGSLYVMRSDGGLTTVSGVLDRPAALIESGPAGGAVAAAQLGTANGAARLLSFDMGGTTAKAGAIVDGAVAVAHEFEAAGKTHSGRGVKGSGYPVRFPFVDLAEISAGGGTIAWLDGGSSLRVGPLSAGADPGPACYGNAERATVTDANVVLGRLNQTALLGGAFPIDAARARAAIATLARSLGMSVEQCAAGVVALVDDAMARVLRIVTVERGLDPREFTLVAFGGGGPLHACAVADEIAIGKILVPNHPGLFSAQGLLNAKLHADATRPVLRTTAEVDLPALHRWFAEEEAAAHATLVARGADPAQISFMRRYDARYRGQSFELAIEDAASPEAIAMRFHLAHRNRYGYDVPAESVELVNARLQASGALPGRHAPAASVILRPAQDDANATSVMRRIWIGNEFVDVPVLQRDALRPGISLRGPAIVEEYDCTTYLAPGWSLAAGDEALSLTKSKR